MSEIKKELIGEMPPEPMTKEEFKAASEDIALLFKKLKKVSSNFENYKDPDIYDNIVAFRRKDVNEFMNKHNISANEIQIESSLNKEERIIRSKLIILCKMIDRYRSAAMDQISMDYISEKIENQICNIMIKDKTGYIRSKVQMQELIKQFMLHEVKLRMNNQTREKLFYLEPDRVFRFKATYFQTAEYFEKICPNKIKVINISWRIR